ncbi:MAG TPA: glycosyltransferase family 4 protein [Steroidobacteraceae bacterium]
MSAIRDENCDIMWRHAPWLYELVERPLLSHVDHIFAVRQSAVARYRRSYPKPPDWVSFMPTWVDITVFSPAPTAEIRERLRENLRRRLGISDPETKVLLTVGRLDKQKDPLLLINAFNEVLRNRGKLHLVLIGDGLLRTAVEQTCAALGVRAAVSLLGVQPSTTIADVLRASDLFVLSSAYEGMPIAVLEALATGVPVVSTNVGEIPSIVRDGINGAVCSTRTVKSLSEAMIRCLSALPSISGEPCEQSATPYHPDKVLHLLYANHRQQGQR